MQEEYSQVFQLLLLGYFFLHETDAQTPTKDKTPRCDPCRILQDGGDRFRCNSDGAKNKIEEDATYAANTLEATRTGVLRVAKKDINPSPGAQTMEKLEPVEEHDTYSQVIHNLFIGDKFFAKNRKKLLEFGIKYIVNVTNPPAEGGLHNFFENEKDSDFRYLRCACADSEGADIACHFDSSARFIADGLRSGYAVLVHCQQGVSRSATIVLAYLMTHGDGRGVSLDLKTAYTLLKARRAIAKPNRNFLRQLIDHEKRLLAPASLKRAKSDEPCQKDDPLCASPDLSPAASRAPSPPSASVLASVSISAPDASSAVSVSLSPSVCPSVSIMSSAAVVLERSPALLPAVAKVEGLEAADTEFERKQDQQDRGQEPDADQPSAAKKAKLADATVARLIGPARS